MATPRRRGFRVPVLLTQSNRAEVPMSIMSRSLLFFVLTCSAGGISGAFAAPNGDCRQRSLVELQNTAPEGYAIYEAMVDKKFFLNWIKCPDVHEGLATAVHESVHH